MLFLDYMKKQMLCLFALALANALNANNISITRGHAFTASAAPATPFERGILIITFQLIREPARLHYTGNTTSTLNTDGNYIMLSMQLQA